MPQKNSKIDDVKRPDKVTPSSTARPILVSNRPTMATDPMMAPPSQFADGNNSDGVLSHSAKSIDPLTPKDDDVESSAETESDERTVDSGSVQLGSEQAPETPTSSAQITPDVPAPTSSVRSNVEEKPAMATDHVSEAGLNAENDAEAEAALKREQELTSLIESGKYAVPINAVQRKRSQTATIGLFLMAIVLFIVLLDAVADVGIVKVPASIPHTHFFSK
jgi:hypothetical protein